MKVPRSDFIRLAAAVALSGAAAPATAADAPALHVLSVPSDGAKSLLYAQKSGLFTKRGVTVDIAPMTSGAAIFAAVLGGSAQFGAGNLFTVFSAFARGVPLRIVAPISIYLSESADTMLIVKKDGPIKTARDLSGKLIGTESIKDVSEMATRSWVDQNGGDGKSMRAVDLPAAQQAAAIDAGRIDATTIKPPYLTTAMATGRYRILGKPLDAIAPRFLLSCFVATTDFIAKNPAAVSGFAAALADAAHYVNAHQAETVDLVAAFSGQDPATIARGTRSTMAETLTLADVQRPLDFAYKYGIVDKTFDVNGLLAPTIPITKS